VRYRRSGAPAGAIGRNPCAILKWSDIGRVVALNGRLSKIAWDSIHTVNINDRELQIVTDDGELEFSFPDHDELSEALLILALQGTKKVEFLDDHRFNPARLCRNLT
jgi:hypothetical protein